MEIIEKINKLIADTEKRIEEENKRLEKLEALIDSGDANEDESDEYTYYDGFKDGLYKELNDLKRLI